MCVPSFVLTQAVLYEFIFILIYRNKNLHVLRFVVLESHDYTNTSTCNYVSKFNKALRKNMLKKEHKL